MISLEQELSFVLFFYSLKLVVFLLRHLDRKNQIRQVFYHWRWLLLLTYLAFFSTQVLFIIQMALCHNITRFLCLLRFLALRSYILRSEWFLINTRNFCLLTATFHLIRIIVPKFAVRGFCRSERLSFLWCFYWRFAFHKLLRSVFSLTLYIVVCPNNCRWSFCVWDSRALILYFDRRKFFNLFFEKCWAILKYC